MKRTILTASIRPDDADATDRVVSPGVGFFRPEVVAGTILVDGGRIGSLSVLGESHPVHLATENRVEVLEVLLVDRVEPVEYGQALFRLRGLSMNEEGIQEGAGSSGSSGSSPLEAGSLVIKAPTAGVFYERPSPGSPAFVERGAEVEKGQTLGLVEVMKCFNQIRFEGPGLPERAVLERIVAQDGGEVANGEVLFVLR